MRTIPEALAARLAGGATTLCHCWKLLRADGAVRGFTDHDRDLVVGGLTYAAGAALDPSEGERELGFAAGGGEVAGVFSSLSLSEGDLAAGLYDGASVETWLVDWTDPDIRLLLDIAAIGEVSRTGEAFIAELRGPAHRLDAPHGRFYQATCDADLGDARCGIDLSAPGHWAEAQVAATDGRLSLSAGGLGGFASGAFAGGRLVWTSGANAGRPAQVRVHTLAGETAGIGLWEAQADAIAPGDWFHIAVGCDKRLATCRDRFGNTAAFRGCPHMPGNDAVVAYYSGGEGALDGGSLFR